MDKGTKIADVRILNAEAERQQSLPSIGDHLKELCVLGSEIEDTQRCREKVEDLLYELLGARMDRQLHPNFNRRSTGRCLG